MLHRVLKARNLQIRTDTISMDKKVDFIGIGVGKAATNWLFECIKEHPDIRGPIGRVKKEIHFFSRNYDQGYAWYHSKFEFGSWKTGEYSPSYFPDKNVPERIYKYHPEVKMLLTLRNPIDRAFSQHRYKVMNNWLPRQLYDFEAALPLNPSYIEYGKYASQLERFLEFFERDSIHIVLVDDLSSTPEACFQQIYEFLGVDNTFFPSLIHKKKNKSYVYRNPRLERFIRNCSDLLLEFFGDSVAKAIKATKIHSLLRKYNQVKCEENVVPPLSPEMRKRLYEIFAEEIERLSGLIDRDLSHWR